MDINYGVGYAFTGFNQPIDNGGVFNVANAGRTIPLKWRLTDAPGAPVTNLTAATVTSAAVPCSASAIASAVETYATTTSGLLNQGDGSYQLNWQALKKLRGYVPADATQPGRNSASHRAIPIHPVTHGTTRWSCVHRFRRPGVGPLGGPHIPYQGAMDSASESGSA